MLLSLAGKTIWFKSLYFSESHKRQQGMQHHCEVSTYIEYIAFIGGRLNVWFNWDSCSDGPSDFSIV